MIMALIYRNVGAKKTSEQVERPWKRCAVVPV